MLFRSVTEESEYLPLPSSALVMSYYEIKAILLRAGYTKREIKESGKQVRAERLDRCRSSFENHDGNKSMLRMAGFTDEEIKKTGKKPIGSRWVDINKGDEVNSDYRSRLVAKEIKFNKNVKNNFRSKCYQILFC